MHLASYVEFSNKLCIVLFLLYELFILLLVVVWEGKRGNGTGNGKENGKEVDLVSCRIVWFNDSNSWF